MRKPYRYKEKKPKKKASSEKRRFYAEKKFTPERVYKDDKIPFYSLILILYNKGIINGVYMSVQLSLNVNNSFNEPELYETVSALEKKLTIFYKECLRYDFAARNCAIEEVLRSQIIKIKHLDNVQKEELRLFAQKIDEFIIQKQQQSDNETTSFGADVKKELEVYSNQIVPELYNEICSVFQKAAKKWNLSLPPYLDSFSNEEKQHYLIECENILKPLMQNPTAQMNLLIKELELDQSDILLFNMGSGYRLDQDTPPYAIELAKQFPEKKIKIIAVDGLFGFHCLPKPYYEESWKLAKQESEELCSHRFVNNKCPNLSSVIFNFFLPDKQEHLQQTFDTSIRNKIADNKIVIVGIHTQSYWLETFEGFETVYNGIKMNHAKAQNLQLYIQCGKGKVKLYENNCYSTLIADYDFYLKTGDLQNLSEDDKNKIKELANNKHPLPYRIGPTMSELKFKMELNGTGHFI